MGKSCCAKSGSQASIVTPRTNSSNGRIHMDEDEAAPCCCCCCCCGPGGCTKRAATIFFGCVGLLLATAIIAPPLYIYTSTPEPQDYTILFPVLKYGRTYLKQIVDEAVDTGKGDNTTLDSITPGQTYKLAIFQLLDDLERVTPCLAFISFCMGCINVPLDLLLIGGACFRKAWPLTPWLVITLIEHIIVGVPMIVFTGLISLYLAAQLGLVVFGSFLIGFILVVFCASMSSWFTVYSTHSLFSSGRRQHLYDYNAPASGPVPPHCEASQLTQPLMMTNNGDFYNGYPSAPQTGGGGMYPSLA